MKVIITKSDNTIMVDESSSNGPGQKQAVGGLSAGGPKTGGAILKKKILPKLNESSELSHANKQQTEDLNVGGTVINDGSELNLSTGKLAIS
mmetsp:Transcript_13395/g.18295  ORF Transcript_13395/g.18295 Transcript_13395/m.18295 type:complete len:92 (+) Transcript_13395:108-383(+)|eukprot:CAMPEP_0185568336 /NCGR_PEP_ID=MMETSP0434-20130131/1324_1 /TAXON_ID=626734 ORGANISM="Favella taraikaensis, Strain Fe Narragansett Bay" /NCGR_SAMPLE_ID=MMETSP0434 /ASSEMBLY_ACC=CAM_ASM_000379 /LENGTH=91 /DNA_ID=CAMNT_0028182821 /DNA_START=38 /DNA_END=313 /DNA_ORIENTATION=-